MELILQVAFCATCLAGVSVDPLAPVPLGEPNLPDIGVTVWSQNEAVSRVEWIEFDPFFGSTINGPPYPVLLSMSESTGRIMSSSIANLDGDDLTDWVLLIRSETDDHTTLQHWEGDETSIEFQQIIVQGPSPPGEIVAVSWGDIDGDSEGDLFTVENTGNGDQVIRWYRQTGQTWNQTGEFPIGSSDGRILDLTFGFLDGDSVADILLVRDDQANGISTIDRYEFSGGGLVGVGTLASEQSDSHRFQAIALGSLGPLREVDLLLVDRYFFEAIHQLQRWEFTGSSIQAMQVLRDAFPPAEQLMDVSFQSPSEAVVLDIPAASAWSMTAFALLVFAAGTLILRRPMNVPMLRT